MREEAPVEIALRKLGMKASVSTFANRIKLQKIVYLSETMFGLNLGFAPTFSWYLYGPYSPKLTKVMFQKEEGDEIDYGQFEGLRAIVARDFFKRYGHSAEKLELIGSLYYIIKVMGGTDDDRKREFQKLKPKFTAEEIDNAFTTIKTLEKTLSNKNDADSSRSMS